MAITLNVTFTDAEQARLDPAVQALLPNLTPAQRKNALEAEAKSLLVSLIKRSIQRHRAALAAAADVADREADDAALPDGPSPIGGG
jgi:hypothetical protein